MTGGLVVILGETGVNFGAGMSGGLAFVYDAAGGFARKINPAKIGLERLADADEAKSLREIIALHFRLTGSPHAEHLVANWDAEVGKFWKVVPFPPTPEAPKPLYRFDPAKVSVALGAA
jgi:glutamate synthase (NADPH/NADH) large chain/glutamate synthase (ferredoxin)